MALPAPAIIYGTAWKKSSTQDLVVKAVLQGYRAIDTACQPKHYNEPAVGEALHQLQTVHRIPRAALYVQTKYTPVSGQDAASVPYDASAPLRVQVAQSVAASLRNLQSDYIDCLLLHSPLPNHADMMQVWQAMEAEVARGSVHMLGVSNCYVLHQLQKLWSHAVVKPLVLQNRFYKDTSYDKELRAWCKVQDITYQSFWTLSANPHILSNKVVLDAAKAAAATPEQVMFNAVSSLGITPLTGTKDVTHMLQDLAAVGATDKAKAVQLTPAQIAAITALFS